MEKRRGRAPVRPHTAADTGVRNSDDTVKIRSVYGAATGTTLSYGRTVAAPQPRRGHGLACWLRPLPAAGCAPAPRPAASAAQAASQQQAEHEAELPAPLPIPKKIPPYGFTWL
eukprot:COSAG01_NODE_11079_length_2012_cov_0.814950_1_plen_114_part_00